MPTAPQSSSGAAHVQRAVEMGSLCGSVPAKLSGLLT
jgi:hypothetical protein